MKKGRKNNSASKNRLILFGGLSILSIFYFVGTLFDNVISLKELTKEQATLEQNLSDLKDEEDYLKNEIVKLKDPEYLARFVRKQYMYSKDGEYVLKLEEKDKNLVVEEKKDVNWRLPLFAVLSTFGFVLLIKKIFF